MRCRSCDYPLWNLTARACPECGVGFEPTDFEFVPNSVRFCCPHCDQSYYGTTPQGHLDPPAFDCVKCAEHVTMSQMVLRPAEGVVEEQTTPAANHWLDRRRIGVWRGWSRTVGQSLVAQGTLMRGTHETSSLGQAMWFAVLTMLITIGISMIPAMCFMALPFFLVPGRAGAGGPSPGMLTAMMLGGTAVGFIFGIVFLAIYVPVWGLVTHGLLRLTGPCGSLRRTMQAICYSTGTIVISVIPCFGNAASIWWVVSAVLMVKDGHQVSGARSTFAVLTLPLVLVLGVVALYAGLVALTVSSVASAKGSFGVPSVAEGQVVLDAILAHASPNQGAGPGHATQLIATGAMTKYDFVSAYSPTDVTDIPIGRRSLFQVGMMDPADQAGLYDGEAAALPAGVVAHRVGDFVFTYHGIDLNNADPGLWVIVVHPHPTSDRGRSLVAGRGIRLTRMHVGRADGTITSFSKQKMTMELAAQNQLRAASGLGPLPAPGTVTHESPGIVVDD